MTQEQANQFLKKVEKYFNNQLVQIKAQGNLEIDTLLISYHSEAIENAKKKIIEDNNNRLNQITEAKEEYAHYFKEILKPNIKSINSQFNIMLEIKETLANAHYSDCIKRGLNVKRINLSSFKVSEYDGL